MTNAQPRHLFVTDVDRTLLTDDYRLLPQVKAAIQQIQKDGIQVLLATARGPRALEIVIKELGDVSGAICFGGALTVMRREGCWTDHPVSAKSVIAADLKSHIIEEAERAGVSLALYTRDAVHVGALDDRLAAEFSHTGDRYFVSDLQLNTEDTFKFLAISPSQEANRLDTLKRNLSRDLDAVHSHANYLEIGHCGISKGLAVNNFCAHSGIPPSRVMAIGDSENDITMLEFAGHSIAMANASPQVQQTADWVTKSNEEGGVAWAIARRASTIWGNPKLQQLAANQEI